jgi:hypothetical protein
LCHEVFDSAADTEGIVHVGCLLELSRSDEGFSSVLTFRIVPWAGDPANAVLVVELLSFLRLFGSEKLHYNRLV